MRPDPFINEPGLTPYQRLGRMVTTRMDNEGESDEEARAAVCATPEGKALLEEAKREQLAKVRPAPERVAEAVAAKWAEREPDKPRAPFAIRLLIDGPLVLAHVDGLPPRLQGMAIASRALYEPPIVVLRVGLHPAFMREVFAHELAHLMFDARIMRDAHEDREARAHEVGALIRGVLGAG